MNEDMKMVLTSPNVVCKKCGSRFFKEVYALKKISPILSPTGSEEIIPVPLYACDKCGEIPEEYVNKRNFKIITGESTNSEPEEQEAPKSSIILP